MVAGLGVQRKTEPEVKSLMNVKEWPRRSWGDDSDEGSFRTVSPGPQRRLSPGGWQSNGLEVPAPPPFPSPAVLSPRT